MNKIFLNIAGFTVKITFKKDAQVGDSMFIFKEKLKNEILIYHNGYIDQEFKKADFYIDFVYKLKYEVGLHGKKIKKGYYLLFDEKSNNRLVSSYMISMHQFQLILQHVLYKLLLNSGFILHSSAVNINGKTELFLGESGAGKSTVIGFLSRHYLPLADDLMIIKKGKESFYSYQTPFVEKGWWTKKSAFSYPIGRVFFLQKADFFRIKRIEDKEYILKRLPKQVFVEGKDLKKQMKLIFEFISEFNEFYLLYFAKDEEKMLGVFSNLK